MSNDTDVNVQRVQSCKQEVLEPWRDAEVSPFLHPAFLRASELDGPGRGRALILDADAGGGRRARWGVLERSAFGLRAATAYAPPHVPAGGDAALAWAHLLEALAARGNAFLRLDYNATVRLTKTDLSAIGTAAIASRWALSRGRFGTCVLDLAVEEDAQLAAMHKKHRQAIRSADREGVTLDRLDASRLGDFYDVYAGTFMRQGLPALPRAYFQELLDDPDRFRFYAARGPDGDAAAVVLVACGGGVGIGLHGGSGERAIRGAGNWLDWKVARILADEGFRAYDLGGVALDSEDDKAVGIRKYKERFGGRLEEHPSVDVAFAPTRYRLIQNGLDTVRRLATASA